MDQNFENGSSSLVADELDVLDFFRYAMRRMKVVIAASLIGFLLTFGYVMYLATPVYQATAQLYVVNSKDSALDLSDLQIGSYLTSDYQLVFNTWEVNQQVKENLSLPYSVAQLQNMVTVTNPSNTRVLFVTVESANAKEAAQMANEFAEVGSRYISDMMMTDMPSILSTALEPLNPTKPRKKLIVALGTVLGFVLAMMGLLIVYAFDDKIKSSADLLRYTNASPLAVVPVVKKRNGRWSKE